MATVPWGTVLLCFVLFVLPAPDRGGWARTLGDRDPDHLSGPVVAKVLEVVDGDTLRVRVRIWLDQSLEVLVRIHGIDTPELHGACASEESLAERARDLLLQVAGTGVVLYNIHHDKYARRVLARVETARGDDVADVMLRAGLARPYQGDARRSWCGISW